MSRLGPVIHGIPGVVPRIPGIKVVAMNTQGHEVFGAGLLVFPDERFRFPVFGLPERQYVLITELGRMPVVLNVELVLLRALYVHVPRIPTALPRTTLRIPVRS